MTKAESSTARNVIPDNSVCGAFNASHFYHAYAWLKLFTLQKDYNKNLTQKDLQLIASSVVLAALSVSPYDRLHGATHLELENEKERNLKMTSLIGFNIEAKCESREGVSRGVMNCVSQEFMDLYHLLENEFLSLDPATKIMPLITKISKLGGKLPSASYVPEVQLSQYVLALKRLATLRLLQQASQVYQSMKIEVLSKMIPFFDFPVIEIFSVGTVKSNFITMKADHLKGVILFGCLVLKECSDVKSDLIMYSIRLPYTDTNAFSLDLLEGTGRRIKDAEVAKNK
ncbi:hypothetical protein GIB67_036642 [Kingdonia uniflora]|uniref:eIF3a PCI domain-containing protein n=1 Tax=Kingdonia uniflora TaxID=39325 RepID=A0A7J7LW99_9MAGN|nr:hypothetical protein GIB67_036642 [Kingdonia uniflora]